MDRKWKNRIRKPASRDLHWGCIAWVRIANGGDNSRSGGHQPSRGPNQHQWRQNWERVQGTIWIYVSFWNRNCGAGRTKLLLDTFDDHPRHYQRPRGTCIAVLLEKVSPTIEYPFSMDVLQKNESIQSELEALWRKPLKKRQETSRPIPPFAELHLVW